MTSITEGGEVELIVIRTTLWDPIRACLKPADAMGLTCTMCGVIGYGVTASREQAYLLADSGWLGSVSFSNVKVSDSPALDMSPVDGCKRKNELNTAVKHYTGRFGISYSREWRALVVSAFLSLAVPFFCLFCCAFSHRPHSRQVSVPDLIML